MTCSKDKPIEKQNIDKQELEKSQVIQANWLTPAICQQARLSRDARFDGKFYTAVLTTGIFCRPICPARAPKEENVRYFQTAAQAQHAGYAPCKRCFPELAPQQKLAPPIQKLADAIDEGLSVAELATRFAISERQARRLFLQHFGLPPNKYAQHQKLLKARQLLTGTNLPIAEVCFAAGFASIRRFNEAIKTTYHETPKQVRSRLSKVFHSNEVSVLLNYRPPFDWQAMLTFFKLRQLPGIELIDGNSYRRTITLGTVTGWIEVTHIKDRNALKLTVALSELSVLDQVISRVRKLFDLDADMSVIHQHLATDKLLAKQIEQNPGIRLPGCWDIFEFSIRAILGQQISVKAATTYAGRIADKYGQVLNQQHPELNKCFPTVNDLKAADFQQLGLTQSRIDTLKRWVAFYQANQTLFTHYQSLSELTDKLVAIKGIGPWTVNYLAMRGLSDPNAFPASDLGVIKALSVEDKKPSVKQILARADKWQPWRAYATLYLWLSLQEKITATT
ncbi:DNA-3-methyladenine glycosylase 2 family protein [Thalassotalea euphylliae]|uniref:DNA-3-methyladenine glycosylase II n=1 Tax=Thalassotalea euphylliae TaxID=1655234 RepID=A0A3E0TN01_9GAMM|nr:DNA-3-methyladenine glycosylase 2 [Thalassotalea euphylliae]REL25926.1 DNA-3-methyladenine glycosylase 2 family protein [Thalassotalea euphylliae]